MVNGLHTSCRDLLSTTIAPLSRLTSISGLMSKPLSVMAASLERRARTQGNWALTYNHQRHGNMNSPGNLTINVFGSFFM